MNKEPGSSRSSRSDRIAGAAISAPGGLASHYAPRGRVRLDAEAIDRSDDNFLVEARISHPSVARVLIGAPATAERAPDPLTWNRSGDATVVASHPAQAPRMRFLH